MNIYPKIIFENKSTKSIDEIKNKLNTFISNKRYSGFWQKETLLFRRNTLPKVIIPIIKLNIFNKNNIRIINIECKLRKRFQIFSFIIFILLGLFNLAIIIQLIYNKTFNVIVFVPFLLGGFIYTINYISFKWEAEKIKYELLKLLK